VRVSQVYSLPRSGSSTLALQRVSDYRPNVPDEVEASEREPALDAEALALVGAVGARLLEASPVRSPGYPGYRPSAWRLRFADGRTLKLRRFASAAKAARIEYVLRAVPCPAFPPLVATSPRAHLSEWIDGHPFASDDATDERLRRCGALHGLVHGRPVPAGDEARRFTTQREWRSLLEKQLAELVAARLLGEGEADRARQRWARHRPGRVDVGFVHNDFCAENLIVCPNGDVYVVDNETLSIAACDFDLARTWYRWPMSGRQRQAYLDGYQRHRSAASFLAHFPFWSIGALVDAAFFRLRYSPAAAEPPMRLLHELLAGPLDHQAPDAAFWR